MSDPNKVSAAVPEGYWRTVFIQDVEDLLRTLAPGNYSSRELFDRYADIAQRQGAVPATVKAFGHALSRSGLFDDRIVPVRTGGRLTGWRVTVKCQDVAEG